MEKNDTSQAEVNLTQSIRRWQRDISTRPSPTPFVVSSPFHATRIKRLKKHYPALSHPYLWLCPLFSCCNSEIRLVTWTNNLGPGLSATPRKLRRKTCQSFTTPPPCPIQSRGCQFLFYHVGKKVWYKKTFMISIFFTYVCFYCIGQSYPRHH